MSTFIFFSRDENVKHYLNYTISGFLVKHLYAVWFKNTPPNTKMDHGPMDQTNSIVTVTLSVLGTLALFNGAQIDSMDCIL